MCRDFTHLAIAFCRCMNIPARYCTGYLSDIGVPPPLCDHAHNRIPRRLNMLGLESRQLERHIAWDPGAVRVAEQMVRLLDVPLVHSTITEGLLIIHSFSPRLDGKERPWAVGVCYGEDRRLARVWLEALGRCMEGEVGDNEPYSIEEGVDYTLPRHAGKRGLAHVMLEIRQDGILDRSGSAAWASRLAQACMASVRRP